jgi:hypothetical protein
VNTPAASAVTIDWTTAQQQNVTLNAATIAFTFTAPNGPGTFSLTINQDATGGRLATWPASVKWAGGTPPTLSTAANAVDVAAFKWNGTNYLAQLSNGFA